MFAPQTVLKPLSSIELSADERVVLGWLRSATWEPQEKVFRAKVPEFYKGVRLYHVAASGPGAQNALEMFIKKLGFQGVIGKQDMYPLMVVDKARYVALSKAEMVNLGVGRDEDEE